jgi:hypothetical protein
MYKCLNCNKEFKYESEFNRHKNRKIACNSPKKEYSCNFCNLKFKCPFDKNKHEKTKKHILNVSIQGNQNQIGDNNTNINSFNNILNLTLNVNTFKNTDTSIIRKSLINSIAYSDYLKIKNKEYLTDIDKVKQLFNVILEILEKLHFSLDLEENHNLKILLIFPGIKKTVYEYLILEINNETKQIYWNSLKYEEMIKQLIDHLLNLNNNIENDQYDECILYLKSYLIRDEETAKELKPYIEEQLGELYTTYNNKQKKDPREIKKSFEEKILEYKNYRTTECKLNNGYNPEIINSNF